MPPDTTKLKIDLKDTTEVACECGCLLFNEAIRLNSVSKILTGTGKDELVTRPVLYCIKCLNQYNPPKPSPILST